MAAENIGELVPTKIPGLSDRADIQAALRLYHYGDYNFNPATTSAAALVNPSIAHTINSLQTAIAAVDISSTIQKSYLSAKGDIISASADNTPALVNLGTAGQVLTVNLSTGSGLQWSTPEVTLENSVTLSNKTLTSPVVTFSTNARTDNYTLTISDANKYVELLNVAAKIITVPLNATVPFPIGSEINIVQTSTGQVSIAGATVDVVINATPGLKLRTQWSTATLRKRDVNTWILMGDLSA